MSRILFNGFESQVARALKKHARINLSRDGAHDRDRTGEPLPYQGSALPTELRGPSRVQPTRGLEKVHRVKGAQDHPLVKMPRPENSRHSKSTYVVPTTMTRLWLPLSPTSHMWWRGEDSNLRRLRRQIYSLLPLAAREPHLEKPRF